MLCYLVYLMFFERTLMVLFGIPKTMCLISLLVLNMILLTLPKRSIVSGGRMPHFTEQLIFTRLLFLLIVL